jgi:hypothetical protein
MSEQYVIQQHYIPQCVLKHFANQKKQVVECLVESGKIYSPNYANSMVERDTYEHPELERNTIEKYFQDIESNFGPALVSIIETIEGYEREENKFDDIKNLIYQYMPDFIKFYYRSKALLTELDFERTNKADKLYLMMGNIANSKYITELSKTLIRYYDFAIVKSVNAEFLLSDQYLSTVALAIKNRFMNVSNRHMGMQDVMLLIPISAKYYVVLYDGDKPGYVSPSIVNNLNQEQIDEINEVIINNSYLKCISYDRAAIERALPKFEYESPAMTMAGGSGFTFGATLKKEVFLYPRDRQAWELFTGYNLGQYINLKRNDKCACDSGKKYKKCCYEIGEICKRMYTDIGYKRENYSVHEDAVTERPLAEFSGKE